MLLSLGKCLKIVNSRYSILVKMLCMDILAALLDSGKTEMGIFIGDCLTVASKFSRASVVCVVYYRYM